MQNVRYDGSWNGFLTVVFEAFEFKWQVIAIHRGKDFMQSDLFTNECEVNTDNKKALRVWRGLAGILPGEALHDLYCTFLSEEQGVERILLSTIQFYFQGVYQPHFAYGRSDVLRVKQTAKMVSREQHRMKAFVRFQRQEDDLYLAMVEPDFNVLPLLTKHFADRYADQRWLIYDLKRKYGIYYNLQKVEEVYLNLEKDVTAVETISLMHREEGVYSDLWKCYFTQTNIKERKNLKLHVQHVPKRYWKYLVEKL